jgi:hypothetical protein
MTLDPGEIISAAGFATGHFDVLDEGFHARLGSFIDWLNRNGNLSREQSLVARRQLLQIVITRLRLAVDRRRIPAIASEEIHRPIFVIGYSRTGTTLLHSLLNTDDANQAPVWWHTHQPSPPPGEMPVAKGRLESAQREIDDWSQCIPGILTMHPYWDAGIDTLIEDEEIHTIDFQNVYPTLLFRIPALAMMNLGDTADPRGCYAFQKQFMQHLQWNLPRRRWVVKGCAHQFQLKELFAEFPDALCIWPHRDPVEVHQSTLAIASVLYHAVTNGEMNWREFGAGYLQSTRQAMNALLANPLIDDPRIIHLRFRDLSKDPIDIIRGVYDRAGFEYSGAYEQRMRAWLADPANRPDRYGRYPYGLEQFGLKAAEVASTFLDYSERFGLV